MSEKPTLGTAITSIFGATVSVANSIPSAVEGTTKIVSEVKNTLTSSLRASSAYALRWEIDSLNALNKSLNTLGNTKEEQQLELERLRALLKL